MFVFCYQMLMDSVSGFVESFVDCRLKTPFSAGLVVETAMRRCVKHSALDCRHETSWLPWHSLLHFSQRFLFEALHHMSTSRCPTRSWAAWLFVCWCQESVNVWSSVPSSSSISVTSHPPVLVSARWDSICDPCAAAFPATSPLPEENVNSRYV